ncbi:MAG: RNA polymerase sigma factor [Bacteroidetes bacterium]|nr:RNA polymerase sigma factor [Bacteroidota bacterium]
MTEAILEHADMLASYARKLTHDRDTAMDLCQDTLLKALANRTSFSWGTDVRPWLFTIMRNQFINGYRRKQLEKKIFQRNSTGFTSHADASAQTFMTTRIDLKETQSAIDEMPAILRTPLHLYSQGYKYQEIAAITETAVGTTKSRIHLARQLLREKV